MKGQEFDTDKSEGLMFKEHREFFITFFQKRTDFLEVFALAKGDHEELKESYLILIYLIESTSAYIIKNNEDGSVNDEIDEELEVISKIIKDKTKHDECHKKIKLLHRKVSLLQVDAEILPKPLLKQENENEQFWRGEDKKAYKEMKKAFYDVVMKY